MRALALTARASFVESSLDIIVVFGCLQLALVLYALVAPDRLPYLQQANISVLLQTIPVLGVIALGVGILMIAGEFDLSVGATFTFAAIFMAQEAQRGLNVFAAAALAVVIGAGIGLANAVLTLRFRIPSFIATLATMLFWQGTTLLYHGASAQLFYPGRVFNTLFAGSIGLVPASFLWFLGAAIVFWALLHRHRLGNRIYAVGGNRKAATEIGISAGRVKTLCFALAGACAAFAGILAATRVGSVQPGQGRGLELQAIAACVIGAVALTGGRGTVVGMCIGAALIYTIQDVLLLVGAPGFYLDIFVGILIAVAAILNQLMRERFVR